MNAPHAVIFTGGDAPHSRAFASVRAHSIVIAADSGWEHAVTSGITPHVLVGDMDSISPLHLAEARAAGVEIIEHPSSKDDTDTELALAEAVRRGAEAITVIAGGGDRPDHVFAMLHSLTAPTLGHVQIDGHLGASRFVVIRTDRPTSLPADPGDTVSLLPVGGDATVTATGLQWPLDHSVLHAHASRGVSNIATAGARVTVHAGTVLAFITPSVNKGTSS